MASAANAGMGGAYAKFMSALQSVNAAEGKQLGEGVAKMVSDKLVRYNVPRPYTTCLVKPSTPERGEIPMNADITGSILIGSVNLHSRVEEQKVMALKGIYFKSLTLSDTRRYVGLGVMQGASAAAIAYVARKRDAVSLLLADGSTLGGVKDSQLKASFNNAMEAIFMNCPKLVEDIKAFPNIDRQRYESVLPLKATDLCVPVVPSRLAVPGDLVLDYVSGRIGNVDTFSSVAAMLSIIPPGNTHVVDEFNALEPLLGALMTIGTVYCLPNADGQVNRRGLTKRMVGDENRPMLYYYTKPATVLRDKPRKGVLVLKGAVDNDGFFEFVFGRKITHVCIARDVTDEPEACTRYFLFEEGGTDPAYMAAACYRALVQNVALNSATSFEYVARANALYSDGYNRGRNMCSAFGFQQNSNAKKMLGAIGVGRPGAPDPRYKADKYRGADLDEPVFASVASGGSTSSSSSSSSSAGTAPGNSSSAAMVEFGKWQTGNFPTIKVPNFGGGEPEVQTLNAFLAPGEQP